MQHRPLLDAVWQDRSGTRIFTTELTTDRWILDGHRTRAGQALIPGTGYLELAAEAAAEAGLPAFELRDLTFLRALEVPDGARRSLRLKLDPTNEGYGFEVRSSHDWKGRIGFALNAQARLLPLRAAPGQIDPAAIAARCGAVTEDPRGLRSPQEDHLTFGPRWRVLHRMALGAGRGWPR
ncbi:hypothetical protein ACFSHQ_04530 [Gemmobacter lanyuensis]